MSLHLANTPLKESGPFLPHRNTAPAQLPRLAPLSAPTLLNPQVQAPLEEVSSCLDPEDGRGPSQCFSTQNPALRETDSLHEAAAPTTPYDQSGERLERGVGP